MFRGLRHIYKAAECRDDGIVFGMLHPRFETTPSTTTNIDYSAGLYGEFQKIRDYKTTRLAIDPDGFEVRTADDPGIDVPDSWVRGFEAALIRREAELSQALQELGRELRGVQDPLSALRIAEKNRRRAHHLGANAAPETGLILDTR